MFATPIWTPVQEAGGQAILLMTPIWMPENEPTPLPPPMMLSAPIWTPEK